MGCALRVSMTQNATSGATPASRLASTVGDVQPSAEAAISPYVRPASARLIAAAPAGSSGWRGSGGGRLGGTGGARLGDVPHRDGADGGRDRQVDEEDQPPGHRADQPAAEEGPDRGGDPAESRPRADGP